MQNTERYYSTIILQEVPLVPTYEERKAKFRNVYFEPRKNGN